MSSLQRSWKTRVKTPGRAEARHGMPLESKLERAYEVAAMLSEWAPNDITIQDSLSKDVKLARHIQRRLQMDPNTNLLHLVVRHGGGECTILQVTLDHSKLNGMQVMTLVREQIKGIMESFFSAEANSRIFRLHKYIFLHKRAPLVPRSGVISIQDVLCAHIFEAFLPQHEGEEDL